MVITVPYDRIKATEYASKWAYLRNPDYYNFNSLGGDCTNFISQCLYAGSGEMNYPVWYYYSINDRSPSWTGVEFLYDFLVKNKGQGPRGIECNIEDLRRGDVIQLDFDGDGTFSHSLLVTDVKYPITPFHILIAAHTVDSLNRPLDSYSFKRARFIHIENVGKSI
ncbi:MAG: amidase domain-containing protein [Clostridia bacterium]|nr:amidase domain-containing protein [Clostridia bacterium]